MGQVAILASYAPSLINFRKDLIKAMVAQGHHVVAIAPQLTDDIKQQLLDIGAEARSIDLVRTGFNPFADIAFYRQVKNILDEVRPNVLISYTIKPVVWGTLAAWRSGVAGRVAMITGLGYAFTGGGGVKRTIAKLVGKWLYKVALPRSTRIIFQNDDDRALFQDMGLLPKPNRTALVNGSGVDTAHFAQVPLPAGPRFLMIARLLGDKGVREYGQAAAVVKQKLPDASFHLVGFLDQSPDCISQAELDKIISSGVKFLGEMKDIRPAMAQASIYVLPSYREGTPRSVLEAMSMGRAIITTDAPGCRETVIHGDNGLLVAPRDANSLADAMLKLAKDESTVVRMGMRSRQIAEDKYDSKKVCAEIMKLSGLTESDQI